MVFKQYRYGGGARGNLPPNTIQTLTSSIPYVARVTNLTRSSGGQDQETLDEVKLRARREMQAQKRAVTAQDFEQAALNFSRYAARVRCVTPGISGQEGGTEVGVVKLLVVPAVADSLQAGDISRLQLNEEYIRTLGKNLDQLRLLTTHVQINEPAYVGVQVKARVVADEFSSPEAARLRVEQHLANFLNPLVVYPGQEEKDQLLEKGWSGWPFGRSLFAAEVYALIQRVPGIKYVLEVEIRSRLVEPRLEDQAQNARPALTLLTERLLRVPARSLLVSLEHEINVIAISDFNEEAELP
jgi:predicted phage baseplate assembly protein